MYLYLSKFEVPLSRNPNIKDYEKYKLKFNKEFICGMSLACYQFTSQKNIYKYALASEGEGKEIYSIYDYAEDYCDLSDHYDIYQGKFFFETKKNILEGTYINFNGKDFLRGWTFIFDHFSANFEDYVLNSYIPEI